MRTNYTSTDETVVLRLTFAPIDGPEDEGHVTVPTTGASLTIDGTDYSGLGGSFTIPADQNAHPDNTSIPYTGTFTLIIDPDGTTALSGTVTGSFDADKIFRPASLTDVILAAALGNPDSSLTLLPPPDDDDVAMGTSSIIIKPM
jgi:hypothetical protein